MKLVGPIVVLGLLSGFNATAQEFDRRLLDSVVTAPATPGSLSLTLKDAVDRALRNNLASLVGTQEERIANAKRLQDKAELFPKIDASISAERRVTNLAAFGFSGLATGIGPVIGPFTIADARAALSQPILDFELRHNLRQSTEMQRAAISASANTREMVVLAAVDLYFRVVSAESRVTAVQAQLVRATALHSRAVDMKAAGVVPGIDVLRAEVEQHSLEQRLILSRNIMEKEKLSLARTIGLSLEQQFTLADSLPMEGGAIPSRAQLMELSYAQRQDLKSLEARARAADEDLKAVKARKVPTFGVRGDFGAIGPTPANSHESYFFRAEVRVPIFDQSIDSEAAEKEAILRQRQAERDSLKGRIELDVRSALLDLQSAEEQLRVARQSLSLAQQQLDQAQDRFSAGVASNLEVVQAQETVALGDEGVIQGLYGFNIARALLARATGSAERSIPAFFSGSAK